MRGSPPRLLLGAAAAAVGLASSTAAAPRKPLLGILERPANGSAFLARLDPQSLKPVSRKVEVGEYHRTWTLSPDGSHVALGVGGQGIGIEIVELETMKLVRRVRTGIAAEALDWLTPRRLVAGLQRGGTVLVDPRTGRILRRWPAFSFPDASAHAPGRFVLLVPQLRKSTPGLPLRRVAGSPRLAVVDAKGRLRSVTLRRIRLGVRSSNGIQYADHAGLVVDRAREQAYVVAAGAPVANVDLRTMRVSYHRLEPLLQRPRNPVVVRERGALALGSGQLVVFGRDLVIAHGPKEPVLVPAGAAVVNTAGWSWHTLDRAGTGVALAGRRIVVYGPGRYPAAGVGLRGYTAGGRRVFSLFNRKRVFDVRVAGRSLYVRTSRAVHVVDGRSGKVVREIAPPVDLVDVIAR
jgi:hypothetical protein